ncbi:hypothetical protein E2C01_012516 [Portunus trituberculatus]|uniref:Uncharacterized protein n=1 Tax=Portunus trituberculatus TaxID=210409 RepID=A0A5B7DEE5_PORTR|nr:hypothetical protein [Portunus trituberculatus]
MYGIHSGGAAKEPGAGGTWKPPMPMGSFGGAGGPDPIKGGGGGGGAHGVGGGGAMPGSGGGGGGGAPPEFVNTKLSEFILEVDSEVHVIDTVYHNVDKLHACHLLNKKLDRRRDKRSTARRGSLSGRGWGGAGGPTLP